MMAGPDRAGKPGIYRAVYVNVADARLMAALTSLQQSRHCRFRMQPCELACPDKYVRDEDHHLAQRVQGVFGFASTLRLLLIGQHDNVTNEPDMQQTVPWDLNRQSGWGSRCARPSVSMD